MWYLETEKQIVFLKWRKIWVLRMKQHSLLSLQQFPLSILLLPSAHTYVLIIRPSKIKPIALAPHPPPDATPFLLFSQWHPSEELPVLLIYVSLLLVFLGAPLIWISSPFLHRAVTHDFPIVNSSSAFSVLIMQSEHLVELIAPTSLFKFFFNFILLYFLNLISINI